MKKISKRRKLYDNPYTLLIEDGRYYILFKDNNNVLHKEEVDIDVFEAFNNFELDDKKILNEFSRHIEHLDLSEELIYKRSFKKPLSLEQQLLDQVTLETLKEAIYELSDTQRRRIIKYFFDNKTYKEIAEEEGCSKVAIKLSIDASLQEISKKLNFWLNFLDLSEE